MIVWRVIRKQSLHSPLSVKRALHWSGRWHTAGTAILYTASSESLALLEKLVSLGKFVLLAMESRTIPYVKLCIELPAEAVVETVEEISGKPADWFSDDPSRARAFGDH